ncbi:hypothetical protein G2W53_032938 [Senna tora]|uniref:Uncharacterized protein n=1 Tax=Senna tora TaxID=362788 RepID=A0A834SZ50_9FABA|nr:hypothetical protein G2W53_032938 [Senna tora]
MRPDRTWILRRKEPSGRGYLNWTIHGEKASGGEGSAFNDANNEEDTGNSYVDMVVNAARGRLIRS